MLRYATLSRLGLGLEFGLVRLGLVLAGVERRGKQRQLLRGLFPDFAWFEWPPYVFFS